MSLTATIKGFYKVLVNTPAGVSILTSPKLLPALISSISVASLKLGSVPDILPWDAHGAGLF